MKRILSLACLLCAMLVAITSCSDNDLPVTTPAARDYKTDAMILSKFVDVNKSIGEYYINEHKKNSPLSYITDNDWEELMLVNPLNRERFEKELAAVNHSLQIAASRPDVAQIVYNTYGGETWVRTIDHKSPISLHKSTQAETRATTRSTWATLQLSHGALNESSFYAGKQIKSRVDINMFGYKMYYFEVACQIEATKKPEGGYPSGGGDNEKTIVMSGQGSMEAYTFTWTAKSDDAQIFWKFKGALHTPQGLGECLIKVEFTD